MKNRNNQIFWAGWVVIGLLAAMPAQADRVSVGLGFSDYAGNFLSIGVNQGQRGPSGRSDRGPGPVRAYSPPRGAFNHPSRSFAVAYHASPYGCPPPPPVVCVPPPVVVVPQGYWREREERVWVEGCWVEAVDPFGRRCKSWQPARWEVHQIREWVQ